MRLNQRRHSALRCPMMRRPMDRLAKRCHADAVGHVNSSRLGRRRHGAGGIRRLLPPEVVERRPCYQGGVCAAALTGISIRAS